MTHRYIPAAKLLSALALAVLAMPSANAGILGTTSSGISLGDTTTTTEDTDAFTSSDLALMRDKRTEARTKLKKLDKQITAMEAALKAKEKSATQAKLDKLKQQRADTQELIDALTMLILQAKSDLRDISKDTDTDTSTDTDTATDSTQQDQKDAQMDAIKQAALTGLLQGMLGNNNSALNGLMNNLTGGLTNGLNGLTGGADGLTGGPTGNTDQTQETITVTDETPDDKKAENNLPECGPSTEDDNSPGRRNAETGSTEGAIDPATTQTSGSGTTTTVGDFGMHAALDRPTTANPEQRDDSGKTVKKDEKKEKPKCKPVDVTTKDPKSQTDALGVGPSDKLKTDADFQNIAGKFHCDPSNSDCRINGQQCASLTKKFAPEVGRASEWRKGTLVRGADIARGTPIATFNYGDKYCVVVGKTCGVPGGGITHTGIYDSQNADGFWMYDQSSGRKSKKRFVPWEGGGLSGNNYSTIQNVNNMSWLLQGIPILQPVMQALKLMPTDTGLLKG